jgi:16S rRNA processing protein RimM
LDYLQIGKIVNTHGVRGEIKIIPLTDDPKRYNQLTTVMVEKDGKLIQHTIERVRYVKNTVIVKLEGIDDMDQALQLKEAFLVVDRKDAVILPEDSYFICDIIGLKVYDRERGFMGVITDVLETGSNDVYVVALEGKKDVLIPALKSVVNEISIENGTMNVILPEGLVDDEI